MMVYNSRAGKDTELSWDSKLTGDQQELIHLSSSTVRASGNPDEIFNLEGALDDMSGKEVRVAIEQIELEKKRVKYLLKRLIDTTHKIEERFKAPVSPNYRGNGSSDDTDLLLDD